MHNTLMQTDINNCWSKKLHIFCNSLSLKTKEDNLFFIVTTASAIPSTENHIHYTRITCILIMVVFDLD